MEEKRASIAQLRRLSALNLYDKGKEYSMKEAFGLFDEAKESGINPDYSLVDEPYFASLIDTEHDRSICNIEKTIGACKVELKTADAGRMAEINEELLEAEEALIGALVGKCTNLLSKKYETINSGAKLTAVETSAISKAIKRLKAQVGALEKQLDSGYMGANGADLREIMSDALDELTDSKEEADGAKEERKERIQGLQDDIGPDSEWSRYIKKPPLGKIADCMDAMDREHPGWEAGDRPEGQSEKDLVVVLLNNFPDLAKKNAQIHELASKGKGKGCLILLAPLLIILTTGALVASQYI